MWPRQWELMACRRRDRQMTEALDRINDKYGNNSVFFAAMSQAVKHDAAPMRIPFRRSRSASATKM